MERSFQAAKLNGSVACIATCGEYDLTLPLLHSEQFNWKEVSKAHAMLEAGLHKGKVVVSIK